MLPTLSTLSPPLSPTTTALPPLSLLSPKLPTRPNQVLHIPPLLPPTHSTPPFSFFRVLAFFGSIFSISSRLFFSLFVRPQPRHRASLHPIYIFALILTEASLSRLHLFRLFQTTSYTFNVSSYPLTRGFGAGWQIVSSDEATSRAAINTRRVRATQFFHHFSRVAS